MDKRRRTVLQGLATLMQNAHIKGFFTGQIYQGQTKKICVPGLNCYSCPGAVGSCLIGSLQNGLSACQFKLPYYVMGLMIFFGVLFGRMVCGFLCPLGFIQDLLHRIPFPRKIRSFRGDRQLRTLKYLILIIMVIILPLCVKLTPFFCKYLCPAGTSAGILLVLSDSGLFQAMGKIFAWKVMILLSVIISALMVLRPFCKYLCPLGAFYAPFNRIAFFSLSLDVDRCVHCNTCGEVCGMCVDPSADPADPECIRCGTCIEACPHGALHFNRIPGSGHISDKRLSGKLTP